MNERPDVTNLCDFVQELLVDRGLAALRQQPKAHAHLGSCDDCYDVLFSLQELDVRLASLPALEPPRSLFEATLALVQSEQGFEVPRAAESASQAEARQNASITETSARASQPALSPADAASNHASTSSVSLAAAASRASKPARTSKSQLEFLLRQLRNVTLVLSQSGRVARRAGGLTLRWFENLAQHKNAFGLVMAGLAVTLFVPALYLTTGGETTSNFSGDELVYSHVSDLTPMGQTVDRGGELANIERPLQSGPSSPSSYGWNTSNGGGPEFWHGTSPSGSSAHNLDPTDTAGAFDDAIEQNQPEAHRFDGNNLDYGLGQDFATAREGEAYGVGGTGGLGIRGTDRRVEERSSALEGNTGLGVDANRRGHGGDGEWSALNFAQADPHNAFEYDNETAQVPGVPRRSHTRRSGDTPAQPTGVIGGNINGQWADVDDLPDESPALIRIGSSAPVIVSQQGFEASEITIQTRGEADPIVEIEETEESGLSGDVEYFSPGYEQFLAEDNGEWPNHFQLSAPPDDGFLNGRDGLGDEGRYSRNQAATDPDAAYYLPQNAARWEDSRGGQTTADLLMDAELSEDGQAQLRILSGFHSLELNTGDYASRTTNGVTLNDQFAAQSFLQRRRLLDNLVFQAPTGYWANTYVPGDPVLRDLQHRLTAAAELGDGGLEMAHTSDAVSQPFDAPENSALAVYLHADHAGANQPTRMLLQVGLQGTERQAGRRPTMNIGVVLDLRGALTSTDAARIRALLEAMTEAHDVGDRFSLTVAGRDGGLMIEASEFRYGTVSTALNQLFTGDIVDQPLGQAGLNYSLSEAVRAAHSTVFADDDPTAPLGSSLVLLVTPDRLGDEIAVLRQLAHDSAVNGVPTSVVGVGNGIDLTELDAVALAGQGNRRLLNENDDAEDLLARELAAASRVVARAVRLRIRLAPGVQLVDVLGSYRLDDVQAERVRQAEVAIDQRLSRNLGIDADRGEDEDGIQIVIPAYYADDSHVILLDVVVPGPGPIADVTVRYKDLVHLRNGVARANLTIGRDESALGPLERNVTKNLVAFELAELLQDTSIQIRSGLSPDAAIDRLDTFAAVLRGLRSEIPGWQADRELERDLSLLARYMDAMEYDLMLPLDIADSLLYASYLKLLPEPEVDAP